MKKLILFLAILFSTSILKAQTYVSGGVYSNTTWTKASSPYIVTDTVVVFPGVTLTIEPGVTVKFEDTSRLEIRQAKIIAIGTATDSIAFTSNNVVLNPGNWEGIIFKIGTVSDTAIFDYCTIAYADTGIVMSGMSENFLSISHTSFLHNFTGFANLSIYYSSFTKFDSCNFKYNLRDGLFFQNQCQLTVIDNCTFVKNYTGINLYSTYTCSDIRILNTRIDSNDIGINGFVGLLEDCDVTANKTGVSSGPFFAKIKNSRIIKNSEAGIINGARDSIINSIVINNNIGILVDDYDTAIILRNDISNNNIGIKITLLNDHKITCNKICNNTIFDIKYEGGSAKNISLPGNYFCTVDSLSTRTKIFDGYVDVKYGLVNFMPLDTSCYKTLSIKENKVTKQSNTKLYPNPFSTNATLEFDNPRGKPHQLSVYNALGQLVIQIENIKSNKLTIERKELQNGFYFYQLRNEEGIAGSGKIVID